MTTGELLAAGAGALLVEREAELAAIEQALDGAVAGGGNLLVLEGPPGIGKTALAGAAARLARERGLTVLAARGGVLERDFVFGVARQLLEPALLAADAQERAGLLDGAARVAARVLGGEPESSSLDDGHGAVHGLYWVLANLAARGPLLVWVDDAQWADQASLRFLSHVVRRLGDMPAVVALATRPPGLDPAGALIAAIAAEPDAIVLRPAPLSEPAVGLLLDARLGLTGDELVAACHEASGGNPFLLRALIAELAPHGFEDPAAAAARARRLAPESIARSVLVRVQSAGAAALALARAMAVLERAERLRHVAELAGVDGAGAARAADALAQADVLAPGRPLGFVHPVVRAALYEDIPHGERGELHARAARILADAGAPADKVAAHLVASEPDGNAWAAERLAAAARDALARGAPEAAGAYGRRALAEPPAAEDRVAVLSLLGRAEGHVRDRRALERLREAHALAAGAHARGSVALALGRALVLAGEDDAARTLWDATLAELPPGERELALRIQAERWIVDRACGRPPDERRLAALAGEVEGANDAERTLLAVIGFERALRGAPAQEVIALAERALASGRLLAAEGAEGQPFFLAANSLYLAGALEHAHRVFADAMRSAAARGSALGFRFSAAFRSHVAVALGLVGDAAADARLALATEGEDQHCIRWAATGFLIDALIERGELDEAERALAATRLRDPFPDHIYAYILMTSRGRLRLARGQADKALADLTWVGMRAEAIDVRLAAIEWRPHAAFAAAALGRRDEARVLAGEELERARACGSARTLALALRASAAATRGQRALRPLREAVELLEHAPATLERAHALCALGVARHAAGDADGARDPLRAALDLAFKCGAGELAGRARVHLVATGARPRRESITGADALTPSERRVAEMAAEGMSNREIAQGLFVTGKTVEVHLSSAYRKLAVRARTDLAAALPAH